MTIMSDHAISSEASRATTTKAERLQLELYGGLLALFVIALFLSLITFDPLDVGAGIGTKTNNLLGPVGAHMADLFLAIFGLCSYLVAASLGYIAVRALLLRPIRMSIGPVAYAIAILLSVSVLLQVIGREVRPFGYAIAGVIGTYVGEVMAALFSERGAVIMSSLTLLLAIIYFSGRSISTIFSCIAEIASSAWRFIVAKARSIGTRPIQSDNAIETPKQVVESGDRDTSIEVPRIHEPEPVPPIVFTPRWAEQTSETKLNSSDQEASPDVSSTRVTQPAAPKTASPRIVVNDRRQPVIQENLALPKTGPWEPPPISLLDYAPPRNAHVDSDALRRNAERLERKLLDYKVEGHVVEIHPGPVVTMYEFLPAAGVKISQIANLADDLTMALEATSIRIVAPIPGKGVVGIEVPNAVRETVYLREILSSEEFTRSKSKLTLALGKDIFGNPVVTDLSRMPHLLIAGATGSGKSVAVNAFILSILYNASPEDVRLILVDPKVVELQVYEGIPHLLLPVVYDPKHAAAALRWAVEEMERRYELLARAGVRNLQSYNQRVEKLRGRTEPESSDIEEFERLPYIVIILDEFADLMMVASKDVETAVARLAQKARAAGIHLVMATQRPSKEVITGLIKANFSSRIAFRVASKIDSRIILDQSGADALLGYGDMLFLRPGSSLLTRVHGPFVSEDEVQRVVQHLKEQGEPEYKLDILSYTTQSAEEEDDGDGDVLLEEARAIVVETRRASISFLQRRLEIGYNRAARIMEQLERRGVVGPPNSRGERQVLI